jgi:hypothetical protein
VADVVVNEILVVLGLNDFSFTFITHIVIITYLLLYPVDITHNIKFNYYTVYFYATHNVKNVTWRSLLPRVDCDVTNKRQFYVVC